MRTPDTRCYSCNIKIRGRHYEVRTDWPGCRISKAVISCANGHKQEVEVVMD